MSGFQHFVCRFSAMSRTSFAKPNPKRNLRPLEIFTCNILRPFFARTPFAISALGSSEDALQTLLAELKTLDRYLNEQEKAIADEIRDWIETKQNLDFQYAAQRLLKLWLFVHIPVTYSLILLGAVHGIVAMLYAGRF